uniref:G_PROTEIN_RECEP_F1_2 domain-containing protein n=1 Tax=Macrostomum lignano TaxID=282301 RepID=A0A1I8HXB8_9PLAT
FQLKDKEMSWLDRLFDELKQTENIIGVFLTVFYTVNNVATILSFIYLLMRKPYSKKVLNWLLLVCFADSITCFNWVFELFNARLRSLPQQEDIRKFIGSHDYNVGSDASYGLILFKCKFTYAVLYFPMFLSGISLTFSCCCRWFTVAFPLKAKTVLTNKRNNSLILVAVLLSMLITIGDSSSYHLKSNKQIENDSVVVPARCCKAYADLFCIPDGSWPQWIWDILRFVKPVTTFTVYFVCLLTSVGLAINLFKASKSRSEMTSNGDQTASSKKSGEIKITAILATMSCLQFVLGVPGDVLRLGVYTPAFSYKKDLAKRYFDSTVIDNFFWDLTKANSLVNWIFHTGLQPNFYFFYLPCLRRRVDSSSQAVTQSVAMSTVR